MTERPVRWQPYYAVVALLCAAVFISYIDRTNISVGAIAMRLQFGWNETQKGVVLSSFYVGYISLMLASGALANRFGGKIVLGAAVIWWSLFTVLTPVAASISLPLLVTARIALGLGEAAVFPASMNMIGRRVPVLQRSRAVALVTSSLYAGTVFALPVTGWLVQSYGWPVPFFLFGAIGLLWATVWFARVEVGSDIEAPASAEPTPIPWDRLLKLSGGLGHRRRSFLQQLAVVLDECLVAQLRRAHLRRQSHERRPAVRRTIALRLYAVGSSTTRAVSPRREPRITRRLLGPDINPTTAT